MIPVLVIAIALGCIDTMVVHTSSAVGATTPIGADRDVEFVSSGITIHGSYRGPVAGGGAVPAAVIIGGTGDVDRDGNSSLLPGVAMDEYRWLADLLSAEGIASIRYDKVGTGATGLGPYASDPSGLLGLGYDDLRIQPARDALAFLARQPGVDPSRLIVIGHSEGGAVALALVNHPGNAPAPAGLALIEPLYSHILDVVSRQLGDQIEGGIEDGVMTAPDAATLTAWMNDGVAEIRSGIAPYPAPGPVPLPGAADFTADMQLTIADNIYGSDPSQMVLTHSYRTRYGKEFDALYPSALAAPVRIPTLITCGTKDFNTPCVPGGGPGSGVSALAASFAPGVAELRRAGKHRAHPARRRRRRHDQSRRTGDLPVLGHPGARLHPLREIVRLDRAHTSGGRPFVHRLTATPR